MFVHHICARLDKLDSLVAKGEQDEISRIIADAPDAIPSPSMRTLWRLFITGRIKLYSRMHPSRFGLHEWRDHFKRDGLTPSLRIKLREHLAPRVALRASYYLGESKPVQTEPTRIKDLVNWELALNSNYVDDVLKDLSQNQDYLEGLPTLLQDFTMLLRDAMDLVRELEGANDRSDLSYIHQPSISEHPQNSDIRDWTILITLVRDSWLITVKNNLILAKNAAENWWLQPYPIFKRLAMFAATCNNVISQRQALQWLLEDNCWWLWSVETQRETIRLVVYLAPLLDFVDIVKLEKAILTGPPREMFREDLGDEEWNYIVDKAVWLLLAKFEDAGGKWSEEANARLNKLKKEHPSWKLAEDERDEFPFWMGVSDEWHKFYPTPREFSELVEWLKEYETVDPWVENDWSQRCRDDFDTTSRALLAVAGENIWPDEPWKQALRAWSEDKINNTSWSTIGPVLYKAPGEIILSLSNEISWWLQVLAKSLEGQDEVFFNLCRRILEQEYIDKVNAHDHLETAINRPLGIVTEALLQWCYRQKLKDDQGLPKVIKAIFINLCDTRIAKYAHGRVVLAAHAVTLYRIDLNWTKEYLLPLFDWSLSSEARLAWEGFLWSPRLYRSFLADAKMPLLEGARHYEELGKHKGKYAEFLTFIALDPGDVFTIKELADAIKLLPIDGLESAARTLIRAIDGTKDKREEYWTNRVLPYLHNVWPKDIDITESSIPDSFTELCVVAGEAFPKAFEVLKYWIRPQKHSFYLFNLMSEKKLCTRFPEDSLSFLISVVDAETGWLPEEFQVCLDEIKEANPELATDHRLVHLSDLARRYVIRY